ncbi:AraC family transcriptional regulator [Bacteroidales bacterium OttesenSCG-928-M11]|nr:AraC family transcriptional regulator [Bacteroidales bacterium OttesenSCG-928-M11]
MNTSKLRMFIHSYPFIEPEYLIIEKEIEIPPHPEIELIELLKPLSVNHPVLQLLVYLDENYDERQYLRNILRRVGTTKAKFNEMFKEKTGTTFSSYMIRLRLHKAAYLLLNSSYTAYQISFICGFNTYSSFRKYFRLYYGKTPGKFTER